MSRKVKVAAIQMDANPAPTVDRLQRAQRLVMQAAEQGAALIVLPELFNTGYAYSDENHYRAEPMTGPTVTWMQESAAQHRVHLAGSLMLLDEDEVYNALLLFAPDGRFWRYNKNYPWGWERGYFRDGHDITVARTELGDVGLLICWDVGHPDLWQRYAGQVDMMVITSCPPDVANPTFHFPDGDQVTYDDIDTFGLIRAFTPPNTGHLVFERMMSEQTAWLQVPAVNTVGSGHIKTAVPNGLFTLLGFIPLAPRLLKYLPQANQLQTSTGMIKGNRIVDANGQVISELSQEQGESLTMAEIVLTDEKPVPQQPQPKSPLPPFTYFTSDIFLPLITIPTYRRGLRRAWGTRMAPVDTSTRRWFSLLGLGITISIGLGAILSFLFGKKKS